MNTENTVLNTEETKTEVRVLKRQPGLGKLNRLTKAAQNTLFANGHSGNRFKRDYKTGTAVYTCSHCGTKVTAQVSQTRGGSTVTGDGLVNKCVDVNS